MQYIVQLSDEPGERMVVLTLRKSDVAKPAADFVFDLIGGDPETLAESEVINAGQIDELKAMQALIFDRDRQGFFIRDGVELVVGNKVLDPDKSFIENFSAAAENMRVDLKVVSPGGPLPSKKGEIEMLARMLFLHEIAVGNTFDVTKDYAELTDLISFAEKQNLIEIDVKKAAYKLTEAGKRLHDSYIEEAQRLIKRYDIFADVDVDSMGRASFGSGVGQDIRIAVMEIDGVDPYRARFLIGLNDGEWDKLKDWREIVQDENWYQSIFKIVEFAPDAESIGKDTLRSIIDQGRARL